VIDRQGITAPRSDWRGNAPAGKETARQSRMKERGRDGRRSDSPNRVSISTTYFFTSQDHDDSHDDDNTDKKIQVDRHLKLLSLTIRLSCLPLYIPQMTVKVDQKFIPTVRPCFFSIKNEIPEQFFFFPCRCPVFSLFNLLMRPVHL